MINFEFLNILNINIGFKALKVSKKKVVVICVYRYFNNKKLDPREDGRITIETKPWGSKLKINHVYTSDSGSYKCVATSHNESVELTASLRVSFRKFKVKALLVNIFSMLAGILFAKS